MGERKAGVMPKIDVHSKYPDGQDGPETVVRVGWTPAHDHVEVATLMPDAGKRLEPTPEGNGWFVQLDRTGINDLIRGLRQARDKAYGRDE